jgi:hypothetical protein
VTPYKAVKSGGTKRDQCHVLYYTGYIKAMHDVRDALAEAKGLTERKNNNVKTVLAWMDCLMTDPDRLLNRRDISMDIERDNKKVRCRFCDGR